MSNFNTIYLDDETQLDQLKYLSDLQNTNYPKFVQVCKKLLVEQLQYDKRLATYKSNLLATDFIKDNNCDLASVLINDEWVNVHTWANSLDEFKHKNERDLQQLQNDYNTIQRKKKFNIDTYWANR